MAQYNGYPSWNAWNVSLWINNDEGLYTFCRQAVIDHGYGAPYSLRSIRLAIRGIID